jgi:hypothetical protein
MRKFYSGELLKRGDVSAFRTAGYCGMMHYAHRVFKSGPAVKYNHLNVTPPLSLIMQDYEINIGNYTEKLRH